MMVLDHVGDQEAIVYAQLGQQPLARTTETSLEPRLGTLSCLSARPPDLATATAAQPEVACVRPSIVPFLHSKRTAVTRSPGSRFDNRSFCRHFEHTSRGTTRRRVESVGRRKVGKCIHLDSQVVSTGNSHLEVCFAPRTFTQG